jgi:hypothetical protein
LEALNSPVCFCHNDLLAGNMMLDEDTKEIFFIDYEVRVNFISLSIHLFASMGVITTEDLISETSFANARLIILSKNTQNLKYEIHVPSVYIYFDFFSTCWNNAIVHSRKLSF